MVFESALSRPSKKWKALIDERTWASDDPLEVQAIESRYVYMVSMKIFTSTKNQPNKKLDKPI